METKIEVIRVSLGKKGKLLAYFSARVTFGACSITLPNLRVIDGENGHFVDVPTRKYKEEGYVQLFFPNKVLLAAITKVGLEAYEQQLNEKWNIRKKVPA